MAVSPYVVWLRNSIGSALLVLPSVTVLVADADDRILLVRHTGFDRWGTVGGMVEPEEHPRHAAVREVKEETGLDVELTALVASVGGPGYVVTYPNGDQASYVSTVFTARVTGGDEVIDHDELTDMAWFDKDSIKELELDRFATSLFTELDML